jgi:ankyrin repeat protein
LEGGADIHLPDNDGNTPLLLAAKKNRGLREVDVVQVLLDAGAVINLQNNYGMSPLHFAASDGHLEIVQVLLERGADINVKNNDGDTPLISAAIGVAATRARWESVRVEKNGRAFFCAKSLCRHLEVVRVLLVAWMFGYRPGVVVV